MEWKECVNMSVSVNVNVKLMMNGMQICEARKYHLV
jgi:hypothetical protein